MVHYKTVCDGENRFSYREERGKLFLQELLELLLGERGLVSVPRSVAVEHGDQGLHAPLQLRHGGRLGLWEERGY